MIKLISKGNSRCIGQLLTPDQWRKVGASFMFENTKRHLLTHEQFVKKIAQNVAQPIVLTKTMHNLNRAKSGPKMWAISANCF
jgi:hypothetical protein